MDSQKTEQQESFVKTPTRLSWVHWAVVISSLILTFFAWHFSQKQVEEKKISLFQREASQVIAIFKEQMEQYEDALWAGVAVVQLSNGSVRHALWSKYVNHLSLLERYPGINGIGVIELVEPDVDTVNQYLQNMRQERENFSVYPEHARDVLLPISYISPVLGNEKAVGLDIAHEDNRYQAAMLARKTGVAQITKAITLVQDDRKTPGFLFYAPYYQNNLRSTEAEREKNFQGMVYAPFIIEKLMNGILAQENRHVAIKITEGDTTLYNEQVAENKYYDDNAPYKMTKVVDIYGQKWIFTIVGSNVFNSSVSKTQPYTILVCGLIIDSLLFCLFIVIAHSNKRAVNYASKVTEKLEIEKNQLCKTNKVLEKTKNQLEKIAHYDMLTNLPNRYSFLYILKKALFRAENSNANFAVCFIDLDNFKAVNVY